MWEILLFAFLFRVLAVYSSELPLRGVFDVPGLIKPARR